MSPTFQTLLAKLERLSPSKLDKTSRRIRGAMADAEWKMGLCLLALKRSGSFRTLGFGTLSAYAERVLQLSGRKVGALLSAAEALEHLPLMSEAFRAGRICWSKVRVMHGLATPETEADWLEFARVHTSVEVERKVALSPLEWKRHRALKASLAGEPSVSSDEVKELLLSAESVACGPSDSAGFEPVLAGNSEQFGRVEVQLIEGDGEAAAEGKGQDCNDPDAAGQQRTTGSDDAAEEQRMPKHSTVVEDRPAPPSPLQKIRLVFELTPDQYALYEQAESRVRAQEGRRLPRAEVLKRMAESVLSQGTAKARARHQVLVHTMEGSDEAWYETERGVLPVASEVLEEALEGQEVLRMGFDGRVDSASRTTSDSGEIGFARRNVSEPIESKDESITSGEATQRPVEAESTGSRPSTEAIESLEAGVEPPVCDETVELVKAKAKTQAKSQSSIQAGESQNSQDRVSIEQLTDHTSDPVSHPNTSPMTTHISDSRPKRTAIPNSTIRRVFARAGHRCECCGRKGGRLDVHHRDPVSEGGGNEVGLLELLCRACHTKHHEPDFVEKPHWRAARSLAPGVNSNGGRTGRGNRGQGKGAQSRFPE